MNKKYFNVLLTKFLFFAPVMGILLPFFSEIDLKKAIFIGFLVTLATFLTADLWVFPRFGNKMAVGADIIISLIIVFLYIQMFFKSPLNWVGFVVIGLAVGAGENYFHTYLKRELFSRK